MVLDLFVGRFNDAVLAVSKMTEGRKQPGQCCGDDVFGGRIVCVLSAKQPGDDGSGHVRDGLATVA
jgi:hypothetical protein